MVLLIRKPAAISAAILVPTLAVWTAIAILCRSPSCRHHSCGSFRYGAEAFSLSAVGRSCLRGLRNRFRPSSTEHLADLLELYDVVQDPGFLAQPAPMSPSAPASLSSLLSRDWRSAFRDLVEGVNVTSEGVVEGRGLIANRDFSAGEVVAFYPIHAIGYSDGRSPPRVHERSERVYGSTSTTGPTGRTGGITGTSDLVYFEDESDVFGGDSWNDFSYAMTDPSGRYAFDVNPGRPIDEHGESDRLFGAHYVNDACYADFSPIVDAAREVRRKAAGAGSGNPANRATAAGKEAEALDAAAVRLAVDYYLGAAGVTGAGDPAAGDGFNVVMCGFGPPPLMAYVTTKAVPRGHEFLATYGLGYWLGKAFSNEHDDEHESVREHEEFEAALGALEGHPSVVRAFRRWDGMVQDGLEAGDLAIAARCERQTRLLSDTFEALRAEVSKSKSKSNHTTASAVAPGANKPGKRARLRSGIAKLAKAASAVCRRRITSSSKE